jgi:hypothetical protein
MFMLTFINRAVHVCGQAGQLTFFSTNIIKHKLNYGSWCYRTGGLKITYFWRLNRKLKLLFTQH